MIKMSRYAVITTSGNKVVNIILWDGVTQWGPGKGYTAIKLTDTQWCDIGSIYDKETNSFAFPEEDGEQE